MGTQKTRIVFDVDDTICSNVRRTGYENCKPFVDVIDKINMLHDEQNCEIVLYTSRGMLSCNGDIDKIIAKNKATLERWLLLNDVHYDELVFGKPIADVYVDDKAMSLTEFIENTFCVLSGGGSGCGVYKLGNIVKKEFADKQSVDMFKDWVDDNNVLYKPHVISYLENAVYMQYIECDILCNKLTLDRLGNLIMFITCESKIKPKHINFDIDSHIAILEKNVSKDKGYSLHNTNIVICKRLLEKHKEDFAKYCSICHGDMILSNMLLEKSTGLIYFIDPQYMRNGSSYLLDFAKLRMSLHGYEKVFGISDCNVSMYANILDDALKEQGIYEYVVMLHFMYVLRLFRYKKDKNLVVKLEMELMGENEDVFARL